MEERKLTEQIDTAISGMVTIQKKFDDNNCKTNEQIENLTKNVTKTLDEIQKVNEKQEAQEKLQKAIETQVSRIAVGKVATEPEGMSKEGSIAFNKYLRKGVPLSDKATDELVKYIVKTTYHDVDEGWAESKEKEMKALVEGVDPNGGYWIKPQMSNKVISRVFESSPVRQVASTETIGTESLEIIIDDDEFTSGGWIGETGTRSDTDNSEIGKLEIHAMEQYAQPKATQRILDDASFNLENWITQKVSKKFTRTENTAFVTGDGANKPKGFLAYAAWTTPATYERGKVEQIASGGAGSFTSDSFINLQNALIEDYQTNANWFMKRTTFGEAIKLKNGTGDYLINPLLFFQGVEKVILGNKVLFANDMPAIASDALAVAYGDFREGYTIVDRLGIRVLRDPFTSKPYVRFYTTKRVGGAVTNYEAIKIMKLEQ